MTLVYTSTSGPTEAVVELTTPGPARHATIRELTTDDVNNTSGVGGATLTDALDTLDAGAVAATRLGFVPVGSSRIGTTFAGCVLQAATVWSTPAEVPPGEVFTWDLWSGGSGGCGGKASMTGSFLQTHGAPASGGAHKRIVLFRADILADLPFSISPGARALGSVGGLRTGDQSSGSTLPATSGGTGTPTSIGTLATVFPGAGGFLDPLASPAGRVGNTGGGTMSAGVQSTGGATLPGGNPGASLAGSTGEGGAGTPAFATSSAGHTAEHGGASCGDSSSSGGVTPGAGARSLYGCSSAGWGGQISTGATVTPGANGGGVTPAVGGAAASTSGATAAIAGNGAPGADGDITHGGDAGAGGGGAKVSSPVSPCSARGGDGGDGGFPGGSGAGGGDAVFATAVLLITDTARGGDGGDGQDGLALCTIT